MGSQGEPGAPGQAEPPRDSTHLPPPVETRAGFGIQNQLVELGGRCGASRATVAATLIAWCTLGAVWPPSVYAYLDPGAGSFVFQALVAGLLGISYGVIVLWRSVKSRVRAWLSKDEEPEGSKGSEHHGG
jgi:hypothetical protein